MTLNNNDKLALGIDGLFQLFDLYYKINVFTKIINFNVVFNQNSCQYTI